MTTTTPVRSTSRALVLPVLATVVCLVLGGISISALSPTNDEGGYIALGLRSWLGGGDTPWLIERGVLPLTCWIQNAPGAAVLAWRHITLPAPSETVTALELPLRPDQQLLMLVLARWTNLVLTGPATVWAARALARRYFGSLAAGAAALFVAIEPNLLACEVLATADGFVVPFAILTLLAYDSYLRDPNPRNLLATGALLGVGTALKISMLPIGMLLIGACFLTNRLALLFGKEAERSGLRSFVRSSLVFALIQVPVILGLALMVSWAANGFHSGPLLNPDSPNQGAYKILSALGYHGPDLAEQVGRLQRFPVPAPLSVLRSQTAHSRGGHAMMFLGRVGMFGPWYYYPYVFAMKTHAVVFVMGLLALAIPSVRRSPLPLAIALIVFLSCQTKVHMGPRYFATLLAFLAVLSGALTAAILEALTSKLAKTVFVVFLAASSMALTLRSSPDPLTHTNPLWGGDSEGYRYVDANYDWGQGLYLAFRAADRLGLDPVCFIPTNSPDFGVPAERMVIRREPMPKLKQMLDPMRGRNVVVPTVLLFGPIVENEAVPLYRAFRALKPTGRLTDTSFYYDLRAPEAFAAFERRIQEEDKQFQRDPGPLPHGPFSAEPAAP